MLSLQNNGFASVSRITPEQVREFLLTRYASSLKELGLDRATLTDDFDFLLRAVIDSFGILEMILSIEDEFHMQLDMARLDAEQITILGPLSRYVAEHGRANNLSTSS
jgi:acyl carrier protein